MKNHLPPNFTCCDGTEFLKDEPLPGLDLKLPTDEPESSKLKHKQLKPDSGRTDFFYWAPGQSWLLKFSPASMWEARLSFTSRQMLPLNVSLVCTCEARSPDDGTRACSDSPHLCRRTRSLFSLLLKQVAVFVSLCVLGPQCCLSHVVRNGQPVSIRGRGDWMQCTQSSLPCGYYYFLNILK